MLSGKDDRRIYIEKLSTITSLLHHILKLTDPDFLTQLTLDVSVILNIEKIDSVELGSLELYTREYIYPPFSLYFAQLCCT